MRNTGKGFVDVSATAGQPFALPIVGRGAAFGDLNDDGQIDAVIGVLNDVPVLLRNNGRKNHWIGVRLVGSKSNRQGIGARVTVIDSNDRRQVFDVSTAGSYLSANDARIVAGLGSATGVYSIHVRWPSGMVQTVAHSSIDRYIIINERDAEGQR